MILDIDEYCQYLIKYNVSPNQFLLCFLLYVDAYEVLPDGKRLYHKKKTDVHPIANMYGIMEHWKKNNKTLWNKDDIKYLESIGFIEFFNKTSNDREYRADNFKITPYYIDTLFTSDSEFEQFFLTYPTWVDNFNGNHLPKIPLKIVDKDEIEEVFKNKINTKLAFDRMMKTLHWSIENNLINMNIKKYLISNIWREHYKMMEEYGQKEVPSFLRRSTD